MRKKSRTGQINRRKGGGGRPLLALLVTGVLIAALLAGLELLKRPLGPEPNVPPSPPASRVPIPPREPLAVEPYRDYTALPAHPARRVPSRPPRDKRSGTVALIIDDMGSSMTEVKSLMSINVPLTFAVIPRLAKDREVAEAAHAKGYEVMIHLPMEPKDYPARRLESNGLLLSKTDEELVRLVGDYRRKVPHAVGANNHMGSRFTEHEEKMRVVLGELKRGGLFFIDSMTTPASTGMRLARELGLETAARNIFLDNEQTPEAIRGQLQKLAATARRRGSAIGICHPHPATLKTLAAALPELQTDGIRFVPASELVR